MPLCFFSGFFKSNLDRPPVKSRDPKKPGKMRSLFIKIAPAIMEMGGHRM